MRKRRCRCAATTGPMRARGAPAPAGGFRATNRKCDRPGSQQRPHNRATMLAMTLHAPGAPLEPVSRDTPTPGPGEVCLRVRACAVCRTDLHIVDGELPLTKLPLVPGHEIVGTVEALGAGVTALHVGDRVGVPWLGGTCGHCAYCDGDAENLCDEPVFTGYTRDGGFATHALADARYCFSLEQLARRAARCSRSRARATAPRSSSRSTSDAIGPAARTSRRRGRSTRRFCSRRSARSCPPHWRRCARAGVWCAPAST